MKANIHPQWNHQAIVTCACGASFQTGSMSDSISVDICSQCHPFFTGEMKFVDVQGRVERFKARQQAAQTKSGKKSKSKKKTQPEPDQVQTLKDLLKEEEARVEKAA